MDPNLFLDDMKDLFKYCIPLIIYSTLPFLIFSLSTPVEKRSILTGRSSGRHGLPEIFSCPDKQEEVIARAEDRLAVTFRYMTSFVRERAFESEAFAKVVPFIDGDIQDIAECVQEKASQDTLLLSQLEFVRSTSQDYMRAVNYLRYFASNKTSHQLARSVVKLNVFLLTMEDPFGIPKTTTIEYDDLISMNIAVLEFWGILFKQLTDLPPVLNVFFESQYTRARQKLRSLENHGKNH